MGFYGIQPRFAMTYLRPWQFDTLLTMGVLALADAKMDPGQNARLAELQTRGKAEGLTAAERGELLSLLHLYQVGQLRKSAGMAETVRRGLRLPLHP